MTKRKLLVLAMVTLIALIAVTPALAAGPGARQAQGDDMRRPITEPPSRERHRRFALVGTITDIGNDTITVEVAHGNRPIQPYLGQELTVQVTENTHFVQWTEDGCVPITFDEVDIGDLARINGGVVDGTFTAHVVMVDVPVLPPTP